MLKNKPLLAAIVFFTLFSDGYAREFSLEELLDIALENNTAIKLSEYQQQRHHEQFKKSKSAYLPKISLGGDAGFYDIKRPGSHQDGNATTVKITANQLLYDFAKTANNVAAAGHYLESADVDITLQKKQAILSIKKAYYEIQNSHQQIIVAREAVSLDELQLSQAKAYLEAGIKTQIEVTNAELQLSQSRLKHIQAEYNLEIATASLTSLLGKNLTETLEIKRDNKDITILAARLDFPQKDAATLVAEAIENRKDLEKLQVVLLAQQAELQQAQAQYYPTLDVSALYSDTLSSDILAIQGEEAALVMNLRWNIYTGNTTQADKKIALANISATKKRIEQKKLEIRQAVTTAYLHLEQSHHSIKSNQLRLDLAQENLDLATERYQAGLSKILELNDATFEYTQAKTALVNAYYTYLKNQAMLEYAIGK